MLEYLSPTSLKLFHSDREEFYLRYCSNNPPPREPQTQPMAVGSAFDAFVKAYLVKKLLGVKPGYDFSELFTAQVEEQNRDWAMQAGMKVWARYKETGALDDLIKELELADGEPRFETTVRATVGGVPFLGKPDLYFKTKDGAHVIIDWKVNGYMAKNKSPHKGYVRFRESAGGRCVSHRSAELLNKDGITINVYDRIEDANRDWASQLCIYAWVLGEEVGGDFVVGIDQLVGPTVNTAAYRSTISRAYQDDLLRKGQEAWKAVQNDTVIEDEERRAQLLHSTSAYADDEFAKLMGRRPKGDFGGRGK